MSTTDHLVNIDAPDDAVRVVSINRPERRNALNRATRRALADSLHDVLNEADVRAVIITGTDPAFCAGLDLAEVAEKGIDQGPDSGEDASPWHLLLTSEIPVIAAVNGAAMTGGFELALACDFIIASERAVFADTHALVGVHPGGGLTATLVEAVGVRRALELSLTGSVIDAKEAGRIGLANHVVAHDALLPTAIAIAKQIAHADPVSSRAIRDTYRQGKDATSRQQRLDIERRAFASWSIDQASIGRRWRSIRERNLEQIADKS